MESLLALQNDIKNKICRGKINYKKSPKDRITIPYLEIRLEQLEQQWAQFHSTHTNLISTVKESELQNSDYYKNSIYDEVEDQYIEYKTELKQALFQITRCTGTITQLECGNSGNSNTKVKLKLPEIKIPIFTGKYTEWQTFRDLFLGLVHNNNSLDDAQKFYYLKGHLKGDAEQLLRNVQVTADSYSCSWEKLERMYNNKKYLASGILNRLLNQKALINESSCDIKNLVSTTSDCLASMKNLGVDVASWDILVIHIISQKLDKDTRKAWELKVSSDPSDALPTYEQFVEFLTGRFRGLESLELRSKPQHVHKSTSLHVREIKEFNCPYCTENHKLSVCKKFSKIPVDSRRNFVQEKGFCFRCLRGNHAAKFCKSMHKCHICKSRHNSLLHPSVGSGSSINTANIDTSKEKSSKVSTVHCNEGIIGSNIGTAQTTDTAQPLVSCVSTGSKKTVLLATAVVKAQSRDGSYRLIRSLMDQGSQGSFITEAMVQYLGLKKVPSEHLITGVGGDKNIKSKCTVTLVIHSRIDPNFEVKINAHVLQSITSLLPVTTVTKLEWINCIKVELADPDYYKPNKIDLLLGAEIYSQVLKDGVKRSPDGSLVAQDTSFGWILSGLINTDTSSNIISHIAVMHSNVETEDILKKFWELEAEPAKKKIFSEEEVKCEELFTNTTRRDSNGRYIVRLPFRNSDPVCKYGESRLIALKRLNNLECKLSKNKKLKDEYTKVIHEYLELGHMQKVPKEDENNKNAVYLPHHAVVREDKDTSKVRVVYDASCKGRNGVSLNDELMVGPQLQAELRHLIMRWRMHKISIVADIIKMYRQVLVDRRDTVFQRILWRDKPNNDLEEYELITVTFGTASAPFLAVRVLHQVADDEAMNNAIALKIKNDFYMDDLMTGAENVNNCYEIYEQMKDVLGKAGFQLQKWISNSEELLNRMRKVKQNTDEELKIKADNIVKILGLTWVPRADIFQYSVDLPPLTEPLTKRKVISDISRLFDPLGWLAPSIILAKVLIQKLWLAGIDWDQAVPKDLLSEWITYRNNLNSLSDIKIPRWIATISSNDNVELHGFSDASKIAYAAVVYTRVTNSAGEINVHLVASKTKVAPIKQVSIPRLELCGATLLAKLLTEVAEVMNIPHANIHAWTDSEVVLAWLNSYPCRWKTFVANRVSEILVTLDTHHWSHVSSKENPADCASRGVSPVELGKNEMWFHGPRFLKELTIKYRKPDTSTNLEEIKTHTTTFDSDLWNKYSSLTRLLRVIAYCRRFLYLRKGNKHPDSQHLSTGELEEALEICIKRSQEEGFPEEKGYLKMNKEFKPNKRNIKSLNLFIDSKDIIRVGDAHQKTLHGGPQLMLAYLRTKYWILGVKHLVKACVRNCVKCIRYSAKARTQLMGQLPSSRWMRLESMNEIEDLEEVT
ncbi:uncharacterized protein LOC135309931 [Plodia interpunctella]|uniref:uncharacterized protein LOC135309931 n=1 Tax=Plodia interpunctella TaxID=58824 RepID=UPI003100BE2A